MRVSLQTMYLDERVHGSGVTRALAAYAPPLPRRPALAVRAPALLRRLGAPGLLGAPGGSNLAATLGALGGGRAMLPPTTEPLPRVHRLFASDRLQGGARRPKAAMPPSRLSTTHPDPLPPQAHHSVHDAGPHRAVRCVCSARGGELELRRPRADADAVSSFGRSAWRTGWECILPPRSAGVPGRRKSRASDPHLETADTPVPACHEKVA